jgi:signal peptidase I
VAVALALAGIGAVALAVTLLRRRFLLVVVNGTSMEPTYEDRDRLLARRRPGPTIPVGSVVVLTGQESGHYAPVKVGDRTMVLRTSRYLVKRLAARPGDPVPPECVTVIGDDGPAVVPPGKVVVFGDNRTSSLDSRVFGFLDEEQILGTVIRRLGAGGH